MTGYQATQANGERDDCSEAKLLASLRKAGADQTMARAILEALEQNLYDGIRARKIYREAFKILKK